MEKAQEEALAKFYNIEFDNEIFKIYDKMLTSN